MTLALRDAMWQGRAACRGPIAKVFFPPSAPESRTAREARESRAKAICRTCGVREECLAYALDIAEPHGIWGGLSEVERRALL